MRRDDVSAPRRCATIRYEAVSAYGRGERACVRFVLARVRSYYTFQTGRSRSRVPFRRDAFSTTFFAGKARGHEGTNDASIATERGTRAEDVFDDVG